MNNTVLKAAQLICAILLIVSIFPMVNHGIGFADYTYSKAEKYTSGDAEITKPVKNLDIDWVNGKVNIAYHRGSSIEISEKSNKPISKDLQMRWYLDGDTLRIRFAKAGFLLNGNQPKDLTVTLPEGTAFGDVDISATSATLSIPDLQAEFLKLDVTSGEIFAAAKAKEITCSAASGKIDLMMEDTEIIKAHAASGTIILGADASDKMDVSTTSGSIRITMKKAGTVHADSTSGDIYAELGDVKKAKIESTSGDVQVKAASLETLKIDTTSGNVKASLPTDPGFTAHLDTFSGKIDYTLTMAKQGDNYICGDGSGEVNINTTSGKITITSFPH